MGPKTRSTEDVPECITGEEINNLLSMQRETIIACFRDSLTSFTNSVNARVDKLANDVEDVKTHANLGNKKIDDIKDHVETLKNELKSTQQNDLVNSKISQSDETPLNGESLQNQLIVIRKQKHKDYVQKRSHGPSHQTHESLSDQYAEKSLLIIGDSMLRGINEKSIS